MRAAVLVALALALGDERGLDPDGGAGVRLRLQCRRPLRDLELGQEVRRGFGLLDVGSARRIGPPIEVKYLGAMEFSPDGASLVSVGWAPRPGSKRTFEVQIWSVDAIRSSGAAPR